MSSRILIVEDEEDNLILIVHVLRFLLRQEDLLIARDGHEAIQMAYEYQPDVILLDLDLPGLSGWDVAQSLKSDPQFTDVPILALTACVLVEERARALDAGCDYFVEKPLDIDISARHGELCCTSPDRASCCNGPRLLASKIVTRVGKDAPLPYCVLQPGLTAWWKRSRVSLPKRHDRPP
jgi:CheY-like chemotaxis protein